VSGQTDKFLDAEAGGTYANHNVLMTWLIFVSVILLFLPRRSSPIRPSDSMSDDPSRSNRDQVTLIEVRNHSLTDQHSSSLRKTKRTCSTLAPHTQGTLTNTIKVRFRVSPVTSLVSCSRTPSILTEIISWFSSVSPGKCRNTTWN
jgi:hypothetical protein